jgi:quinolinate synthase
VLSFGPQLHGTGLYHTVPDGDSELSRKAVEVKGDPIIFCGVRFMAETAKILNPTKPSCCPPRSGMFVGGSITAEDVRRSSNGFQACL